MSRKGSKKGNGYVFKRGTTYYLQYNLNGRRKKISLGVSEKREAEKKAKEILDPIRSAETKQQIALYIGEAKKILTQTRIEIDKVWAMFCSKYQSAVTEGTKENYERHWRVFKVWLESTHPEVTHLNDLTDDIAEEYAIKLKRIDKLSASTFNQNRGTLRMVHGTLATELGATENPWDKIPRSKEPAISRKELSEQQVLAALATFNEKDFYLLHKDEMRVLFHLGTWTGLRLSDCALMKWEFITLDQNLITCVPLKTKRHGTTVRIPIHPTLREQLALAQEWRIDCYVLPKVAERYRRNPRGVKTDALKVFQEIGLETSIEVAGRNNRANIIGFHSLRHSFVSFCANNGVPLAAVQAIVGHSNPAITKCYTHVGMAAVEEAIKALPGGDQVREGTAEERVVSAIQILEGQQELSDTELEIRAILLG